MNGRTYVLILFFWAFLTVVTPMLVRLSTSAKLSARLDGMTFILYGFYWFVLSVLIFMCSFIHQSTCLKKLNTPQVTEGTWWRLYCLEGHLRKSEYHRHRHQHLLWKESFCNADNFTSSWSYCCRRKIHKWAKLYWSIKCHLDEIHVFLWIEIANSYYGSEYAYIILIESYGVYRRTTLFRLNFFDIARVMFVLKIFYFNENNYPCYLFQGKDHLMLNFVIFQHLSRTSEIEC